MPFLELVELCMRCNGIKNEGTIDDHHMVIAYMRDHFDRYGIEEK